MKQRINLLIAFSIVALVVLSTVQCYLVKTTYDYKVAQFHTEIKNEIAQITNNYSDIDSALVTKKEFLYKEIGTYYIQGKKTKFQLKKTILENEFTDVISLKIQQKLKRELPNLKIDFAIVLNKFIIYQNTKKNDTIFSEKPSIQNKLYGNLASLNHSFLVRNYVGTTNGSFENQDYKLLTEDSMYVAVIDWEMIILKRMTFILVLSLLSIATLITLFVIAIKALIKQKKVSDVKTDFINNITHELKTPLATLSISTKILEQKNIRDNDEKFISLVNTISRQNNRLQHLIDQVMANSLAENQIELQKEKIITEDFLLSIIKDFKIGNPQITIETDFQTKKTILVLDQFHLTTAILNVLENAVKYGSNKILLTTKNYQNQFTIAIEDNGIGISKNKQALLFEKFYRVEQGNLHTTKGLGLGLYYVHQIIKAHQGSIAVMSDLGKGAVFTIMFKV
ncbi:HAMP domain-containing sensor histidine kinase [Flavobacterium sp. Fl-77]|uniref:histidine kinase n=1 Tax=Flavobacterium flavipigmentatum TaxID=2893884 RepID=A0AAJ2SGK2_9FLAO|nr:MULTISPECIES: HAMP domain-containing sensor histidine kinase [unclassified Flavobacterium]MDX6182730.1 HAMP domain-containing sensor histidine kinase [Flavobacterium sp. Fl-33]MDX6186091.1 HAMP domain-containing sensor histidine kinase [Flavobacterium sp. Fl-77]UFH38240.1 HAMP domain-containing histidine kinase [Flavobacterium sp. F-70]